MFVRYLLGKNVWKNSFYLTGRYICIQDMLSHVGIEVSKEATKLESYRANDGQRWQYGCPRPKYFFDWEKIVTFRVFSTVKPRARTRETAGEGNQNCKEKFHGIQFWISQADKLQQCPTTSIEKAIKHVSIRISLAFQCSFLSFDHIVLVLICITWFKFWSVCNFSLYELSPTRKLRYSFENMIIVPASRLTNNYWYISVKLTFE